MIEALQGMQGLFHFDIVVIDVDADPELERRHRESVPVLMHDGIELCHFRFVSSIVTAYLSQFR